MISNSRSGKEFLFSLMLSILCLWVTSSCGIKVNGEGKVVSHELWSTLLKKHVGSDGLVDYKGFIKDRKDLQSYLDLVSNNAPARNWNENDKIAYWLNTYNAYTVKLIIDNYPLKSIKDLGPENQIIFINTPWDKDFFEIGKKTMSLNKIEHRIIRNQFKEPRIHFALNCASMSCPVLRNEAYEGNDLDKQLTEQAKRFLSDDFRNQVNPDNPQLSSIFNWYGGDFKKWSKMSLVDYINQYSSVKINEKANFDYIKYDWNLNDQKSK